jgi:hypothetical protein
VKPSRRARPRPRELTDQGQRGRYVGADRDTDDNGAGEEHHRVHRERDQHDARGVDQQVPLVDPLAAELVAQPATEDGADRAADGVWAR